MTQFEGGPTDHEIDEGLRSLARQAGTHEPGFTAGDISSHPRWPSHFGRIGVASLLVVASVAVSVIVLRSGRGHHQQSSVTATTPVTTPVTTSVTPSTVPGVALGQVNQVHFLSATVGWAASDNSSRLLMTSDGGAQWRDVSPPALRRAGYVLDGSLAGGAFMSATDFWVSVSDIAVDDEEMGVLREAPSPAVVFHTTNGGLTWSPSGSFPRSDGNVWIEFANDHLGWVEVGNGQAAMTEAVSIYLTTNDGRSWSLASRSMSATGAPGTAGGPALSGDKAGLGVSAAPSPSGAPTLWLASSGAVTFLVSRSTDEGRTWTGPLAVGGETGDGGGIAYPPVFVGSQTGAFQASYGTQHGSVAAFVSTTDGGRSWSLTPSPKARLLAVVSPTTWVAAGGKTVYLTTDGGLTWSRFSSSVDLNGSDLAGQMDFVNTLDGWAILGSQHVWHTTDGGRVWTSEPASS
jgi:photosystem II stability/assembly factor-like uncharacterized protein